MKALARNKQTIYYANRTANQPVLDEDDLFTGEYTCVYTEPEELRINVAPATGTIALQAFGLTEQYDKVLVTDDLEIPLDKESRLWVGIDPKSPHNYVVTRISKSLNSVAIALTEVDVSA